jgi:hypothetical protein
VSGIPITQGRSDPGRMHHIDAWKPDFGLTEKEKYVNYYYNSLNKQGIVFISRGQIGLKHKALIYYTNAYITIF